MHRYFFVIQWAPDEHDDHSGTLLSNDDAARSHALRIIRELKAGGGYDEDGLSMIVKDAARKTVLTVPFAEPRLIVASH
jgi:hypothetical protein